MMLMKNRSLVLIYTIVLFAAAAVLGITACSGTGISEFYGIMENNPKLSMLLALLSVPVPMAIVLKTFDFGEKDGAGKAIASFIVLLIGEILLMAAISAAMPAIEFSMYMGGWLRKIAAAAYAALIAIPSVYVLVRIVSDGIFGFGGFIEKVASVIAALLILYPALSPGWFVITKLWWLGLIIVGLIVLIGFLTDDSGSSTRRRSSFGTAEDIIDAFSNVEIYQDEAGNKYVKAHTVTAWDKCWQYLDTSCKHTFNNVKYYRIKE